MTLKPHLILFLSMNFMSLHVRVTGQSVQNEVWKAKTRLNYYTNESTAELILNVPGRLSKGISVSLYYKNNIIIESSTITQTNTILPFPLADFPEGRQLCLCILSRDEQTVDSAHVEIVKLPQTTNAVKIDRLTGGLVVEDLPFFPFGFYCYSPVSSLPEEEVVQGFNMISPYQTNDVKTFRQRKAYMDRCADLGMKVHYHLLDVIGKGNSQDSISNTASNDLKRLLLKQEVEAFRDHPALLAWYISDEPDLHRTSPEMLQSDCLFIHELDPYHPVSIVFMAPHKAKVYREAMDIVMSDPYPIPNQPAYIVGNVAKLLHRDFALEKPVWIVPQAFGGNEWWKREPTPQEIRVMTYLGIIHRATGIQYFIRHGPNRFPKSLDLWSECGIIAREIAELTPFLLSDSAVPAFRLYPEHLLAGTWAYRGRFLIIVVNTENRPALMNLILPETQYTGKADVQFENREIDVVRGQIRDMIAGYSTRIYQIPVNSVVEENPLSETNLMSNSSFEDIYNTGVPSDCYALAGGDRGSTYFIDSRVSMHGEHSLRLTAPRKNGGVPLSFFPVSINPQHAYTFSIYGKTDPKSLGSIIEKKRFREKLFSLFKNRKPEMTFQMSIGDISRSYILDSGWKRYDLPVTPNTFGEPFKVTPRLVLTQKGTAWFDLIGVYEDPRISFTVDPSRGVFVSMSTVIENASIHYTLDGSEPDLNSPLYKEPLLLTEAGVITAGIAVEDSIRVFTSERVQVHKGIGKRVTYRSKYAPGYPGKGKFTLNDGLTASPNYRDDRWQGFEGNGMDITFDLGKHMDLEKLSASFLQDIAAWIFLPRSVTFSVSADGRLFTTLETIMNSVPSREEKTGVKLFEIKPVKSRARYVRIQARNIGRCPSWHRGAGNKALLFADEIVIE